jgi:hypothetical protein
LLVGTLFLTNAQAIFGVEVLDLAFHRIDLRYWPERLIGNLALVGQLQVFIAIVQLNDHANSTAALSKLGLL